MMMPTESAMKKKAMDCFLCEKLMLKERMEHAVLYLICRANNVQRCLSFQPIRNKNAPPTIDRCLLLSTISCVYYMMSLTPTVYEIKNDVLPPRLQFRAFFGDFFPVNKIAGQPGKK